MRKLPPSVIRSLVVEAFLNGWHSSPGGEEGRKLPDDLPAGTFRKIEERVLANYPDEEEGGRGAVLRGFVVRNSEGKILGVLDTLDEEARDFLVRHERVQGLSVEYLGDLPWVRVKDSDHILGVVLDLLQRSEKK